MRRNEQRGASNVGCILALIVLAVVVVLAMKILPSRVAVAELQDYCEKSAEQASLPHHEDDIISDQIMFKAQSLHLPVSKENIKVWRNPSEVFIEVKYTVPLNLIVTTYDWHVEVKVDRTLF